MLRGIKGVKDILPDEIARWQLMEDMARRLSLSYGYQEIRVPVFEMTELFARSIGASTDIVEKEMYTFQDRDGTSLTLRPEATAGVVRAYIEHNLGGSAVSQKFFYLGPMFRHERPQAGRLRQFHQYGVEYFGMRSPLADVEVVSLLWRFLSGLGLPDLTLEINSLGDAADRPPYKAALLEFLKTREDRLCQNCRRRMGTNPLRVLDCKVPGCQTATEDAPRITDHLSAGSRRHFEDVQAGLRDLGIPFSLNSRLVVTSGRLGAQNAVAAGGRYDGLVEALGGASTPAVGFAVGLERVALVLPASAIPRPHSLIFVAAFGEQGVTAGTRVLDELRGLGLRADTDYRASTLKAHLRQADRLGAEYVVIIGDDEVTKGRLLVRNMRTKEQEELPLLTAARSLSSRLKIG
ncbi:MAG: histidine--tRNA ligase [Nitrospirae bacterium 13_2_20CM_62_7]|nr:MAG: histidine--tRNA ligase [Nitrospirae bacterium 13_2_20CM_62_7]